MEKVGQVFLGGDCCLGGIFIVHPFSLEVWLFHEFRGFMGGLGECELLKLKCFYVSRIEEDYYVYNVKAATFVNTEITKTERLAKAYFY
jgi:hypothetical protein